MYLLKYEYLGFIAGFFELLALYLLGKKINWGFVCNIVGGILWISYVFLSKSTYGLLLVCSVAFILNCKGFINWKGK